MTNNNPSVKKQKRTLHGRVVSAQMSKTLVVVVERTKIHPRYHKRYKTSRHYKVHDEKNQFKVGDLVAFVECRPLSKDKKWRVLTAQK